MHHLWAPWRLSYVTEAGNAEPSACVFCQACEGHDPSPLTLHDGAHCYVILNKYPYSNGHVMVVPRRHLARLADVTDPELAELMALTRDAEMALTEVYEPHGLNIGLNLGRSAGAGVVGHLHVHVVPRWNGDTNFMTVTADTRVVPEEPAQTVARLRPVFARLRS